MAKPKPITADDIAELRRVFRYEPDTGLLFWAVDPCKGSTLKAGALANSRAIGGYLRVAVRTRRLLVHRVAWCIVHGAIDDTKHIDHINGNRTDNRICNLRMVDARTNLENSLEIKRKSTSSGLRGVSFCKQTGRWASVIMASGKRHHLGRFSTKEEAADAYLSAKLRLHPGFVPRTQEGQ